MASPFPGMDPFLEHPALFPDLHDSLIAYIREYLQLRLPEPYYNVIGSRVWVEDSRRFVEPDIHVLEPSGAATDVNGDGGSVATLVSTRTKPVLVHVPQDEFHETFIEIQANYDGAEHLVTVIEILSRTNKTPGAHGRDQYLQKQKEVLGSSVNLVEIDLLRYGTPTTAVPIELAREKAGQFDYHVCVHQFDRPGDYLVYPVPLQERLPEIVVPLRPGDQPVTLDVQSVFERAYETGPYRRRVRYQELRIEPRLTTEQLEWAKRILQIPAS